MVVGLSTLTQYPSVCSWIPPICSLHKLSLLSFSWRQSGVNHWYLAGVQYGYEARQGGNKEISYQGV